jgi:hypothetical protein
VHKGRHETDLQVGAWRHKTLKLSSIFATEKLVISSLHQLGLSTNVLHENRKDKKSCPWWDTQLLNPAEW